MDRELLLLGVLRQQEMHGYQLAEFITRDMAYCTDLKKSTAYYLLKRMAEEGWIIEHEEQEGNRPTRTVYQLTEQGEQTFQRLLRENLAGHDRAYFTDDVGLALLEALDPAEARSLLGERRARLLTALDEVHAVPHHGGSFQLVLDHRIHHLQSEIDWVGRVLESLNR